MIQVIYREDSLQQNPCETKYYDCWKGGKKWKSF